MLTLDAYFDETGHGQDPNTKLLGLVGCVAPPESWLKLEIKWKAVLSAESLPYFHMNEFAHSRKTFKGWKDDNKRRDKIYGELWSIILEAAVLPIGSFVVMRDYNRTLKDKEHNPLSDAYYLCYLQCLKFIAGYIEFGIIDKVSTFFDDKEGFKGEAFRIYDRIKYRFQGKIPQPVFRNMREFIPLQVADVIAYESKKELERQLYKADYLSRQGFHRLDELIKETTGKYPLVFGDESSPIVLHSNEELEAVSEAQRTAVDED